MIGKRLGVWIAATVIHATASETDTPAGPKPADLGSAPSHWEQMLNEPKVQDAVRASIDKQIATGTFYDETALRRAVADALPNVAVGDLPPMVFAGADDTERWSAHLQAVANALQRNAPPGQADWQRELQRTALQPEIQAAFQRAALERARAGLPIDAEAMDEIERTALEYMPEGPFKWFIESLPEIPHGHQSGTGPQKADETLARLSVEDQKLLEPYRGRLAEVRSMDALPSMDSETRRAAMNYIRNLPGGPAREIPALLERLQAEFEASPKAIRAAELGYWDKPNEQWHVDGLIALVHFVKLVPNESVPSPIGPLRNRVFDEADFTHGDLHRYLSPEHYDAITLKALPRYAIPSDARGYVIPDGNGATRIYTETIFGGPMRVTESMMEWVGRAPSWMRTEAIAGNEAKVSHHRYEGDRWVTRLSVHAKPMQYDVEVGAKLEGVDLDKFIAFVRDLVENG